MSAVRVPAIAEHTATFIFMHGLGDSGSGWKFLADDYRRRKALEHVEFVFPNAPKQKVTLNFGLEMPSWFDIISLDKIEAQEDSQGMLESVRSLRRFIDIELEKGIKPERIIIGGFSQGCTISLLTGLTSDIKLGGVVALSGFIPMRSRIANLHKEKGVELPFFVGHGTNDPVVKYEYGVYTKTVLDQLNLPVEFHEYKGLTHSAAPQELDDLLAFLNKTIPK
ncbi:Phospholipase/carboxylesterase/thioesterase [Lipomyces japonicus]|uniref:Phospholipase/carboxylesterase/thioesterase n=1 Tax=Lipomyces japonicus TaxID=56871 RepID=UPI0034CFD3E1